MSRAAHPLHNSALAKFADAGIRAGLGETAYAASSRGVVFAHAVGAPFRPGETAIVSACAKCIYSEVPWPRGWATFHERAGVTPLGTHAEYIAAIKSTILDTFEKPAFIVCSKRDAAILGHHPPRPIGLYGDQGWLAVSYAEDLPEGTDTVKLVEQLAQRYRGVYDFSCGYGNALRPFGYIIGSDIDKKCLDYIAREIL